MSLTIKYGKDICNSPINNSLAKQMYSFSKAPRFPEPKKKSYNNFSDTYFYDLPSTKMKRTTSFGFGKKSDFTILIKGYKTEYNDFGSDFDLKHPHGPKYSFSNGREKYDKVFLESHKMIDKNIPGPAKYNYLKTFGNESPKYTMRARNDNPVSRRKDEDRYNPTAPGKYDITVQINPQGKYTISQQPNFHSISMANDKSRRYEFVRNSGLAGKNKVNSNTIEISNGEPMDTKSLLGKIFNSKYLTYEPKSMHKKLFYKDSRTNYPGPGSYMIHSDFGQYQSKDADKYPKENVYPEKKLPFEEKAWRNHMKNIKTE